jgi:hypothetical protein
VRHSTSDPGSDTVLPAKRRGNGPPPNAPSHGSRPANNHPSSKR